MRSTIQLQEISVIRNRKIVILHKKTMRLNVHFYMLNEHFSQDHADAQHNGEESENNLRYEWEDELSLTTEVRDIKIHRKAIYTIAGQLPSGDNFAYEIPEMLLFNIEDKNGDVTQMACSESIVDSFELKDESDNKRLNVYLKESEPHTNPIPGIYIALQEFPKELAY